jgi:hypothetical protein
MDRNIEIFLLIAMYGSMLFAGIKLLLFMFKK